MDFVKCIGVSIMFIFKFRPNYNAAVQRKNLKVSCKIRPCPCLDRDPDFCEVLVKQPTSSRNRPLYGCKNCIAALAAEQDDICGQAQCDILSSICSNIFTNSFLSKFGMW